MSDENDELSAADRKKLEELQRRDLAAQMRKQTEGAVAQLALIKPLHDLIAAGNWEQVLEEVRTLRAKLDPSDQDLHTPLHGTLINLEMLIKRVNERVAQQEALIST